MYTDVDRCMNAFRMLMWTDTFIGFKKATYERKMTNRSIAKHFAPNRLTIKPIIVCYYILLYKRKEI